jgi:hypothetical protein
MAALEQNIEGQEVSKCKGSTPYILDALVDEGCHLCGLPHFIYCSGSYIKNMTDYNISTCETFLQPLTTALDFGLLPLWCRLCSLLDTNFIGFSSLHRRMQWALGASVGGSRDNR